MPMDLYAQAFTGNPLCIGFRTFHGTKKKPVMLTGSKLLSSKQN
jgi:hypothetical protein